MSTWIYVANLPMYADHSLLQEVFQGIGQITNMSLVPNQMIMKSVAFVQFENPKHAKTACSKKDGTIVEKSQIRVFLCWMETEDLSTVRVTNFPEEYQLNDLHALFNTFGDIVNVRIMPSNNVKSHEDDQKIEYQPHALVSFVKIEHATAAAQELNGSVIGYEGALHVELVNSDARNLQWKRHSFEYIAVDIPKASSYVPGPQRHRRRRYHDSKNGDRLHPPHRDRHHNQRGRGRHRAHRRHEHDTHHRRKYRDDPLHSPYSTHSTSHKRRSVRDKASQSTLLTPLDNTSNGQYHTFSVTPGPSPTRSHFGNVSDSSSNDGHGYYGLNNSLQRNNSTDSIASNHSVQSLPASKRTAMDHYGMPSKYGTQTHHSPQPYYPQQPPPPPHGHQYQQQPQQMIHTPASPSTSIISTGSTTHSVPTPTGFIPSNAMTRSLTPTGLCVPAVPSLTPTSTTPVSTPTNLFAPGPINPMLDVNGITNTLGAVTLNPIHGVHAVNPINPPIHLAPHTNQMIMQQISAVDGSQCTGNIIQNQPVLYSPPTLQSPIKMTPTQSAKMLSTKKRKKSKRWTKEQERIGNELHALVEQKYPENATKIVGMMLSAYSCENLRFMMQQESIILQTALGFDQQVNEKEARRNKK